MTDFDRANPSYKVDFNIPVECAGYKIILENNVYTLTLKSGLATRILNGKITQTNIQDSKRTISITIHFDKSDAHIYNYMMDRAEILIDELTEALDAAYKYFDEFEVSRKAQNTIDKYITNLARYEKTWNGLTNKPDYALTLFRNRMLPYFNLECKDWVKSNLDAIKGEYPTEIVRAAVNKSQDCNDYHEEMSLANRNNNFLEWNILPVDKYPDMQKLLYRIEVLNKIGLKRQAITMILRLMVSPRECHIVREPTIWKLLKPEITANKDYDELVRYCYFYAMYILRQEEIVMFSQVNVKYRVLYTLEQASTLPNFQSAHIERNPYIIQLTDDTPLGQTMPFYLNGKRSINDMTKFQRRFHLATGGAFKGVDFKKLGAAITGSILIPCVHTSPLESGFGDVDWNREREGIKLTHPYMIDTPETTEDENFVNYLEYYYPSYVSLTDKDFLTQVLGQQEKEFVVVPESNELDYEDDIQPVALHVESNQSNEQTESNQSNELTQSTQQDEQTEQTEHTQPLETVEVNRPAEKAEKTEKTERVNMKVLIEDSDEDSDEEKNETSKKLLGKTTKVLKKKKKETVVEYEDDEEEEIVEQAEQAEQAERAERAERAEQIEQIKSKVLDPSEKENKSMRNAVDYNQLADIDISITTRNHDTFKTNALALYEAIKANCSHRGAVHIKEVKTIASVKYKIYGSGIPRPMDIFRIPYDPIKMVKKFHVHAVKMFYDGDVTLFRSCVSCLLSGVGESYKWFSCNKVPADVLLKYAQRGLTIIHNRKERDALSKYIVDNERWGLIIKKLNIKSDKIYCCVTERHPFFRPGIYNCGVRLGLRNFEHDSNVAFPNTLVVSHPKTVFPYGELNTHNNKKIYMPDVKMINVVLDYIENGDAEDEEPIDLD